MNEILQSKRFLSQNSSSQKDASDLNKNKNKSHKDLFDANDILNISKKHKSEIATNQPSNSEQAQPNV